MYSSTFSNSSDISALGMYGFGLAFFIVYFIFLIGFSLLFVFYFKTMIDTMTLVKEKNRDTGVSNILFLMVPLYSLYYCFVVYPRISSSIQNEFIDRGMDKGGDYGRSIGIAMSITTILCLIPLVNILAGLATIVLVIIYWSNIDGYKNQLASMQNFSDESTVENTVVYSSRNTSTESVISEASSDEVKQEDETPNEDEENKTHF